MNLNINTACLALVFFLSGCSSVLVTPPKETSKAYRDFNAYLNGHWVLLAESAKIDWFYDPASLEMDEDYTVSFNSYWLPNEVQRELANPSIGENQVKNTSVEQSILDNTNATLFEFNATGPYLQKINCFSNTQLSETLGTHSCDVGLNLQGSQAQPGSGECWHFIRPKTAMAYIQSRVCGRRFLMEESANYFLYQTGRLPSVKELARKTPPNSGSKERQTTAMSFEVVNNEYIVTNEKNNIREMRVASYFLDRKGMHDADYIYKASCRDSTYSFSKIGQPRVDMKKIGGPLSLSGVAFNRICGDHGIYMKQVKAFIR